MGTRPGLRLVQKLGLRLESHTYLAGILDEGLIQNARHFVKEGLPGFFRVTVAVGKFALQQCDQAVRRQRPHLKEDKKICDQ